MSTDLLSVIAARLSTLACTRDAQRLVISDRAKTWSLVVREHRGVEHAAVFVARICDERSAPPDRVLRLAASIGAGALALEGDHYVARYTIPAASIATAPIERIALYLHELASTTAAHLAATARDITGIAFLAA